MRVVHGLVFGLALAGSAALAACGGEAQPNYGPADGIVGRGAPEPGGPSSSGSGSSSGGGSGSSSGSSSGGGTGSGSGSGSGSGGGGMATDGGTSSGGGDGGQTTMSCTVSWANQVFPIFKSTGSGQCATATCHGGANAPTIVDGNAGLTYTNLTAYTINGLHYIAAGATSPAASSIECNTGATQPACGIALMPQAPATLSATDQKTIATWLTCGAPNN